MEAASINYIIREAKNRLQLPDAYEKAVKSLLMPVVDEFVAHLITPTDNGKNRIALLGVQGSQGSGKTTCSEFIKILIENKYNLHTVVLSIDDFYLSRAERCELSKNIHPLLKTRGVPGTHDIELAIETIKALSYLGKNESTTVPRFDKAIDDRLPKSQWKKVTGPVDVVILEGWCVGLNAQAEEALSHSVNKLEEEEDSDLEWRKYVNKALAGDYQTLFSMLDKLLVLKAPSFDCVYRWRRKQEQRLIASLDKNPLSSRTHVLTDTQLKRFVQHYERLTRHGLETMPKRADWCLYLEQNHNFEKLEFRDPLRMYNRDVPYVVFTDLDGTLLDHYSYSWDSAADSLRRLKDLGIPVIINTSKTAPEVIALQKALDVTAPFIVENGSALYVPKGFCDELIETCANIEEDEGFYVLVFGKKRSDILEVVYNERANQGLKFTGYYDWDIEQLIQQTGLKTEDAEKSMARRYSEPIVWQDSGVSYSRFAKSLDRHNLKLLTGGRFEHVIGRTSKAKPICFLKSRLFNKMETKIICLGDTNNDIDMLELADIPVCVKSPVSNYPKLSHASVYHTTQVGPKGWSEAIEKILQGKL